MGQQPHRGDDFLRDAAQRELVEEALLEIGREQAVEWQDRRQQRRDPDYPAAALLGLPGETVTTLELGLLTGTPGLAAIGLMIAALTLSLRAGAALAGLLLVPLAVPLLIFGAGALSTGGDAGLALTAAISLLLCAVTPFAAGAAIRAARES